MLPTSKNPAQRQEVHFEISYAFDVKKSGRQPEIQTPPAHVYSAHYARRAFLCRLRPIGGVVFVFEFFVRRGEGGAAPHLAALPPLPAHVCLSCANAPLSFTLADASPGAENRRPRLAARHPAKSAIGRLEFTAL